MSKIPDAQAVAALIKVLKENNVAQFKTADLDIILHEAPMQLPGLTDNPVDAAVLEDIQAEMRKMKLDYRKRVREEDSDLESWSS